MSLSDLTTVDRPPPVDAWSVEEVAEVLAGVAVAAMVGGARRDSARLVQGHQPELDLFLADTLARAAERSGVAHIHAPEASEELRRALACRGALVLTEPAPPQAVRFTDSPGPGVRQVQRLPCPPGASARSVAEHYLRTVPRLIGFGSRREGETWHLGPFLTLAHAPESTEDRAIYTVVGGLLGTRTGRLEFREVLGGEAILAAVVDFEPRLVWPLYRISQAPAHVLVMRLFGRMIRHRVP